MAGIAFELGYLTAWLWNRHDMPLDMPIGEILAIGGGTVGMLQLIHFLVVITL